MGLLAYLPKAQREASGAQVEDATGGMVCVGLLAVPVGGAMAVGGLYGFVRSFYPGDDID